MADWIETRDRYVVTHRQEFADVLGNQGRTVNSLFEIDQSVVSVASIFDRTRWDKELGDAVALRLRTTAGDYGSEMAGELRHDFDAGQLDGFCESSGHITAQHMNAATEDQLQAALLEDPAARAGSIGRVYTLLLGGRLKALASSTVTMAASLGRSTAAEQAAAPRKRWHTWNPDSRHADIDGEEVDTAEVFSNGLRWPGDPRGDAGEVTNCTCSVEYPT